MISAENQQVYYPERWRGAKHVCISDAVLDVCSSSASGKETEMYLKPEASSALLLAKISVWRIVCYRK